MRIAMHTELKSLLNEITAGRGKGSDADRDQYLIEDCDTDITTDRSQDPI